MTRFSQRSIDKLRDMARTFDTAPPFEGELRLDLVPRVIEDGEVDQQVVFVELITNLVQGHLDGVGYVLEFSESTVLRRTEEIVVVAGRSGNDRTVAGAPMFRGVAFGWTNEPPSEPEQNDPGPLRALWAEPRDAGHEVGDVVACRYPRFELEGDVTVYPLGGGAQCLHGTVAVGAAGGEDAEVDVTFEAEHLPDGVGFIDGNGRIWRLKKVRAASELAVGQAVLLHWDSADLMFRAVGATSRTLYEVTEDLTEGGDAANAYLLDSTGARTATQVDLYPSPYETGESLVGPFRGVAFAAESSSSGFRGDVVEAVYIGDKWIAVGGGRTGGSGTAGAIGRPGTTITVQLATSDSRTIEVSARCLCTMPEDAIVQLVWNGTAQRWDATSPCRPDEDDELPDPGDPEDPPGGGGGGPGCGCGLPPGVECSPLDCCPEDDTGLTVTDCEEFATAPEEYYVEVPPLTCVPDCATGNEPDETSGLPPGRVVLTHVAGTCEWLSEVFDCGDGHTWYWQLMPSLDGRSWLRLLQDADVVVLQWQTGDAWCPRCDNDVEIYCPPDECTDLTERLCVKPVCTNCADGICYTVDNPTDWDGVSSASFTWQGDDANSGVAVTDPDEGRPTPPSRKITLVYGTVPANVDGAAVVETFPGIAFDPTTCGVDLDGVCGIELSVKVQSDESVGDRGVRVGIAIKQGTDSFVATIGSARLADGWKTFSVNRLLAADFDKVTATGFDDATHPDWTTPGAAMTFGVCLWQEDGTVDDAFGDAITVVANWDILRLCLESEPCTGDPASYVCPDAVTIAACQELGTTVVRNVPFTNDGDTPFRLVSVLGGNALQTACGGTAVTVDIVGPPQFLGPLQPGETRNIVITVERGLPLECSGALTIHTDLPGADAVCVVPVDIVILAEDECDVGGACTGTLDDEFPEAVYTDNTPLEGGVPSPKDGNCVWGPVWSQMMDMSTGALSGTTAGLEFVYNTDTARPAIGGDPTDAVTGSYPSRKLVGQELEGFAAEFGTSYMLSVGLNRGTGGINEERGAAIVLYTAEDYHFSVQWDRLDHKLRLVSWDGNGNKTEHETWTDGGNSEDVWVGIWRLGSLVKVAARIAPPTGDLHNATMWDDPEAGGNGHIFADVRIPNGHDKLAIAVFTAAAPLGFPTASVFHLCCNGQQGTAPKWEA